MIVMARAGSPLGSNGRARPELAPAPNIYAWPTARAVALIFVVRRLCASPAMSKRISSLHTSLRRLLVDPDRSGSLADRARRARKQRLFTTFPEIESMCVLDLGGTAACWHHMQIVPAELTLVNIVDRGAEGIRSIIGDACDPPAAALDREYDLVLSNSVIDQVGGLERRRQMAAVIPSRRTAIGSRQPIADSYWMRTSSSRASRNSR